jgi:ABC-type polysaccharide/polyol phosphate export permease
VIFPLANVPEKWGIREMMKFHPATPALDSIHRLFLDGDIPGVGWWLAMFAWVIVTVASGFIVLSLLRREIRDVL